MARLPLLWNDPNGAADQNNWGSILKTFLLVAHNADGTLITSLPVSSPVITGSITFPTPSTPAAGESITNQNNALTFSGGSAGVSWNNQANTQQRMALTDAGLLTVGAGLTVSTGSLIVSSTGPHAIGGATIAQSQLLFQGTFNPGTAATTTGFNLNSTIVGASGQTLIGMWLQPTITLAGSPLNTTTLRLEPPAGSQAGATNSETLHITGAPTGATNNYALWVASGNVLIGTSPPTATAKFGVHPTTGVGGEFVLDSDGGGIYWGTSTNTRMGIITNNSTRWIIAADGGLYSLNANGASKGLDTLNLGGDIFVAGSNFLMRKTNTLNNGAAAQTATLTNGPAAGNPTKWVAIDDNGTTRYIPAW